MTGNQQGGSSVALLRIDVSKMGDEAFIPRDAKGVKFSMLRQQHYERAKDIFGTDDFHRLFVVHAMDGQVLSELGPMLVRHKIYWLTIKEIVEDLLKWYGAHKRTAALRNTLVGDLFHLLVGFCHLGTPARTATSS
jgi:hypothetical protein